MVPYFLRPRLLYERVFFNKKKWLIMYLYIVIYVFEIPRNNSFANETFDNNVYFSVSGGETFPCVGPNPYAGQSFLLVGEMWCFCY